MLIYLQIAILIVNCREIWNDDSVIKFHMEQEPEPAKTNARQSKLERDDGSYYIDDLEIPFRMPQSLHPVPSVGHGAVIKFGQVMPLLKKILIGNFVQYGVMDALRDDAKRKKKKMEEEERKRKEEQRKKEEEEKRKKEQEENEADANGK